MSRAAAALFARLQEARFYVEMHRNAVDLLPSGSGRRWLDAGCGPGLLARLAAAKGYDATGVDHDADMIERARRLETARGGSVKFALASLEDVAADTQETFDVVSASSLLVVAPNPAEALRRLVRLTRLDGRVLVIEAGAGMSRRRAFASALSGALGEGALLLPLWAMARAGRTLPESVFDQPGLCARRHPLLGGLAEAWIVEKKA